MVTPTASYSPSPLDMSSLYEEIDAAEQELEKKPFAGGRLKIDMSSIRFLVAALRSTNAEFGVIQTVVRRALSDLQKAPMDYLRARAGVMSVGGSGSDFFRQRIAAVDLSSGDGLFPEEESFLRQDIPIEEMYGGSSHERDHEEPPLTAETISEMFSDPHIRVQLAGMSMEGPTPEGAKAMAEAFSSVIRKVGQVAKSAMQGIGHAVGGIGQALKTLEHKVQKYEMPPDLREYQDQFLREVSRNIKVVKFYEKLMKDRDYNSLDNEARFRVAEVVVDGWFTEQEVKVKIGTLVKEGAKQITVDKEGNLIPNSKL